MASLIPNQCCVMVCLESFAMICGLHLTLHGAGLVLQVVSWVPRYRVRTHIRKFHRSHLWIHL